MSEGTDEIHLVQQAQSGSRQDYEELIRRYARLVWSVIYGIIKDPVWTEDVVQETFLKAWQMISQLREPDRFRGWLLTIARRNALQHNETLLRQGQISEDLASRPADEESNAGDLPDDQAGLREQLHTALRKLPERYKVPITLRYLEGFDYKKISHLLGLSDGSLRGLLNRGMKLLRETLKPRIDTDTK